ncbi:uncharacterized protein LOC142652620 [Rhinoderma darwinii]|uniref:uncharacterized protein LOC142652620 n=1 Tax=Rhinoderma darwinii TaxID=43563 RepID=UPI003F677F41
MSGDSPGRGHPGRGLSPRKAQASRPLLGENSQALSNVDTSPKVNVEHCNTQDGSTSGTRKEDEECKVSKANVAAVRSTCESEALVGQSTLQAPGVQLTPPASRQRRTSLERLTLQQSEWVASVACSGRTRSSSSKNIEKSVEAKPARNTQGVSTTVTSLGECDPAGCETSGAGTVNLEGSAAFRQPEILHQQSPQSKETERAPELQLAEEIPALVRRMGELQSQKQMLQIQIDCVYKLKNANPKNEAVYAAQLYSLGMQLAQVVGEMDGVLERMGPLAESYKNKERFSTMTDRQNFDPEFRFSEADSGSDIFPDDPRPETRLVLQPARFSFLEADAQKEEKEKRQKSAAVSEQGHGSRILAQAPQVPGCSAQQDSGRSSMGQDDALTQQSCTAGAQTGGSGNVPEGLLVGGNARLVYDVGLSDDDIEVDGSEDVQNNVLDFPPLIVSTQGVTDPSRADTRPISQDSETRQPPPRNAWSRGAPSFTSGASYTGQAFKRRNVVRFKHKGAKEDLPDRRFVVRELLCHQMGFVPANILAVINLPDRQGYDVSFKLTPDLDRFWAHFSKFRDKTGWDKFSFIPVSKPDTVGVNIIFWNEAVPPQDIVVWLRRHCDLVSDLTKNRDADGIWTGGWRVLVKLRQHNNVTLHLPNSFFIGREKGVCFYPGQLRKCFKCGKTGHLANICTVVKCNLCGEVGHLSSNCQNVRCNLCGRVGHPHRDCPDAWHNICKQIPVEEFMTETDAVEEEALMSGSIMTRQEVQQESGHPGPEHQQSDSTQETMEVVPRDQPPAASSSALPFEERRSMQNKRKKKDTSSRKPEGEEVRGRKKGTRPEVMVVSNRFSVLSESDGDFERELLKIDGEYEEDTRDHPLIKKKPCTVETPGPLDMETGGRQSDPNS